MIGRAMIGPKPGPQEMTARLGEGGTGVVCRAEKTMLRRSLHADTLWNTLLK